MRIDSIEHSQARSWSCPAASFGHRRTNQLSCNELKTHLAPLPVSAANSLPQRPLCGRPNKAGYAQRKWQAPRWPPRVPLHREPATVVHYHWWQFWALANLRLYTSPGARENSEVMEFCPSFQWKHILFKFTPKINFKKYILLMLIFYIGCDNP